MKPKTQSGDGGGHIPPSSMLPTGFADPPQIPKMRNWSELSILEKVRICFIELLAKLQRH
jgi:hypothetical protein